MTVLDSVASTALTIVLLAVIADERMRAHSLRQRVLEIRAIAIGVGVTLTRGWLAWRGVGGIETSIVLAIAAVGAISDLQCGYVFDRVLFAGGAGLMAVEAARGNVVAAAAGGTAGAAILAIPWALSRARGMGLGDVKLAGVLGCGLGLHGTMRALWFAFVIGAIVAIAWIATGRRSRGQAWPFAPFLALGTVLSAGGRAW